MIITESTKWRLKYTNIPSSCLNSYFELHHVTCFARPRPLDLRSYMEKESKRMSVLKIFSKWGLIKHVNNMIYIYL